MEQDRQECLSCTFTSLILRKPPLVAIAWASFSSAAILAAKETLMSAIAYPFVPNTARYEGVRPIQVYILRTFFLLMFLFVGFDSWSAIVRHHGPWDPMKAAALAMFASYSTLAILGVLRPLKMLPILVFVLVYKTIWLAVVAYPLWSANQLAGSPAEPMTKVFAWVLLLIPAVPWKYFVEHYVLGRRLA
jgi:hypothetical protein